MFNWMKTAVLMAGILALFAAVGGAVGGSRGVLLALAIGAFMNLVAYWNSDKMVLRMYNAQEVDETSAPQFYNIVKELASRAGLPMPRVYVIDEEQPNAFATGRNPQHAAVAATTGILRLLSAREMRGVIGHELSHVRHRDILLSTVTAIVAAAISNLAQFGMFFGSRNDQNRPNPIVQIIVIILAPIAAMLIQLAISRAREFEADRGGAELSGDPNALADALIKIESYARGIPMAPAEAHPSTAQMMIVNPLSGGGLQSLFSSHPPTEVRVERLRAMAA